MICPTLIFCTVFIKCKEYCSIRLVSFLYASFMIFRGLLNRLKINNFSKATIRSSLDNYYMVHIYYFGKLRVYKSQCKSHAVYFEEKNRQ